MLLKQVKKGQDRWLIKDPDADQIDTGKATHGGHLDQCLFHRRIAEGIPLLQKMDLQHGGQWIRRAAAQLAGLGVVVVDQLDQRLPWHLLLYHGEKPLPFGLLFGS